MKDGPKAKATRQSEEGEERRTPTFCKNFKVQFSARSHKAMKTVPIQAYNKLLSIFYSRSMTQSKVMTINVSTAPLALEKGSRAGVTAARSVSRQNLVAAHK